MSSAQAQLLPEGFTYYPHVMSHDKALKLYQVLVEQLDWQQPSIKVFGRSHKIPRLQCYLADKGVNYMYSGLNHNGVGLPQVIDNIRRRLALFCNSPFNAVLANWYRDGQDAMGLHSDDEPSLGELPIIASISLGGERVFKIKQKRTGQLWKINLEAGSLLVMHGASQLDFQHGVSRCQKTCDGRLNLTFRHIQNVR